MRERVGRPVCYCFDCVNIECTRAFVTVKATSVQRELCCLFKLIAVMNDNNDEKLQALLARKEKLLNMKRIIERSTEEEMNSSESFIENSDTETETRLIRGSRNTSNYIVNSSTESISTKNDMIKTSTISLPRSHSFFNKPDESLLNSTGDNYYESQVAVNQADNSFSYILSDAIYVQNAGLSNVITKSNPNNSHDFEVSDKSHENNRPKELENIEELSNYKNYIDMDTNETNLNVLVNPNKQLELHHISISDNIQIEQNSTEVDPNLNTCNNEDPVNIITPREEDETTETLTPSILANAPPTEVDPNLNTYNNEDPANIKTPREEDETTETLTPSILANELEVDQQNNDFLLEAPSTSRYNLIPIEGNSNYVYRNKNQRVTSKFVKSCMDFNLDEEKNDFSSGSSDLWSENEEILDESEEENTKRKRRKRKKFRNEEDTSEKEVIPLKKKKTENIRKTRKYHKEHGLAYKTLSGKVKEARNLHENPCKEEKCIRKCYEITEERRKSIFDYFWTLNDEKKRDWIVQCCRLVNVKRKKTKNIISRRSVSYEYFINEGEGRRQVCQQFILKTLDITQTYLLYTVNHAKEGLSAHDSRTRTAPDKYDENTKLKAKAYIESLPALPSHYSRKKSNKLYLPEQFRNLSNLYRLYVKHCQEISENYLSEKMFSIMFKEYNFAFHVPKKDKCSMCTKKENNPDATTNEDLKIHLLEKEATYKRFHIHQNLKSDQPLIVASFDLQKVLATPHGESMMLYYSRKYAVYNFTVYECKTQNGYCYTWGEADGKRGSCEIATCLLRYLKEVDRRGVETLILYCDNCTGQNKNRVILSMFKHFLQQSENLQTIQINYLLPGHTYMPVDSMHAIIEREVKNLIIWAPSQWPTLMQSARKRPKPYSVEVLEHTDFINFNNLADTIFTPVTLRNKDLRMKQIRVCTFKKTDLTQIHVKYTMLENGDTYVIDLSKELDEKGKGKGIGKTSKGKQKTKLEKKKDCLEGISDASHSNNTLLTPLYKEQLSISVAKYNDLKKLCETGIVPKRFHREYLSLSNQKKIKDTLNSSDEDDCEDDDNV